jgi:hypothetical protein
MTTGTPELAIEPTLIRAHYSALTAHRDCPSKWHYRYVLRIKQPDFGPKPEMHFGSWWGALTAAEALERGRRYDSLKADPTGSHIQGPDDSPKFDQRTVTVSDVFDAADAWWRTRDPETVEEWVTRLGQPLPERLRALYARWMDEFAAERANERPLGLEVFWRRNLPRPKNDAAWSGAEGDLAGVELIGYIDEVYLDVSRNIVVVRDRKSHKVLKPSSAQSDMMDSQLQLYTWGASPIISAWGHGAPRAVAYDRARSVAPKQPEVTKTAGTLSKSVTDYDLGTYLEFVRTDTRPTAEIEAWLTERREAREALGMSDRSETEEYVSNLPAGAFWGEFGAFVQSGANKGKPKFGVYQEDSKVVEKLSTPASRSIWFQRTRVPVNRNVVIGHLRAAIDTATDAWRTTQRFEATHDAARNLGRSCDFCDYAALCRARLMGGADGDYDLLEFGLTGPEGRTLLSAGALVKDLPRERVHEEEM